MFKKISDSMLTKQANYEGELLSTLNLFILSHVYIWIMYQFNPDLIKKM